MRAFFNLAVAAATALVSQTLALPIVVSPGTAGDLIITKENTINGTASPNTDSPDSVANPLKVSLVNNFGGGQLNAYVTGQDPSGSLVMLGTDGKWYRPDPQGSSVPVEINASIAIPMKGKGEATEFNLPDYISSGRIWVAEGKLKFFTVVAGDGSAQLVEPSAANPKDPSAAVNWGFVELTNTEKGGIYANISFVDFVGLVMGMSLTLGDGTKQTVKGLGQGAIDAICKELKTQAGTDSQPWDELCVTDASGKSLRVVSPNLYLSTNAAAMETYYDAYIEQVWAKYASTDLTINTQADAGKVACRVSGDTLTCAGDNRGYRRPTVADIWGCNSGAFEIRESDNAVHRAVVPRLCAAFYRTTLLAEGGALQPSLQADSYYKADPTSHYSRIVHAHELDGKGYTFSYDDVNPDGENEAGVVSGMSPQTLEITVGGFSS